jgi:hypothetical protein
MSEIEQLCMPLLRSIERDKCEIKTTLHEISNLLDKQGAQMDPILDRLETITGVSRAQVRKIRQWRAHFPPPCGEG